MSEKQKANNEQEQNEFGREVRAKAARKLHARRNPTAGIWSGFGMMGLVGWSVVVPTLLGAAIGMWLDNRYPSSRSWTLALLVAGLALGCFNAWNWIATEEKGIHKELEQDDE